MGWGLFVFFTWPIVLIVYGVVIVLPIGSLLGWVAGKAFRHFWPANNVIIFLEFLAGVTGFCIGLYLSGVSGGVIERWEDGVLIYRSDTTLTEYWIPLQVGGAVALSTLLHLIRLSVRTVYRRSWKRAEV